MSQSFGVYLAGFAVIVASVLYAWLVLAMRIPEARQIEQLIVGRLRGRTA